MKQMTLTEYLESKETLRKAVSRTPQKLGTYKTHRHCRLMIENSDGKKYLALNPSETVNVLWLYEDHRKPIPIRIYFENVNAVSPDDRFYTSWSGDKLEKWLKKNTISYSPEQDTLL